MIIKPPRTRKCDGCTELFNPVRRLQKVCSPKCAEVRAAKTRAKKERKQDAERKVALKSRSQWLAEAQTEFNAFIRERDADQPCISCGRFHDGKHDAGHYRSVGAMPALRFHEDNVHRQCVPCNQHKSGNVIEYRLRLIHKIGADRLELLERDHPAAKHTIDEAKQIKTNYKAKRVALLANREVA